MMISIPLDVKKWSVLLLLLFGFQIAGLAQDKGSMFTIYLVRHAEKVLSEDNPKDPSLTPCGEQRAASLEVFLSAVHLDAIYSSDYTRTRNTAQPAAQNRNLETRLYDHKKLEEFAKIPTYYVMDFDKTMPEQVMEYMPSQAEIDECEWLPDNELKVFSDEFSRTQFQGTMNSYRCATNPKYFEAIKAYTGKTIEVPVTFIAGAKDWGPYQSYGNFEAMKATIADLNIHFIEGAGHWVQQEKPNEVNELMIDFINKHKA